MLIGGGGHDELFGAGGVDELSDGDIDGGFPGAGVDGDRLDGGSGGNFLSYRQRTEGIEVDLAAASLGRTTREGDVLVGIQHVVGGEGDDRLAGNERVNVLDGGAGRDRLEARGGNDDLRNGESTSCGSGRDLLWGHTFDAPLGRADDLGLLERDCERFFVNGYDFEPYPRRSRSTLTFQPLPARSEKTIRAHHMIAAPLRLRSAMGRQLGVYSPKEGSGAVGGMTRQSSSGSRHVASAFSTRPERGSPTFSYAAQAPSGVHGAFVFEYA